MVANVNSRASLIARRAGWLCSFPTCCTPTGGATSDGEGEINAGTAAHICAAAPGGPRYDETMSPEERSSAKNGIWMCRDHGKAIDSTDPEFTSGLAQLARAVAESPDADGLLLLVRLEKELTRSFMSGRTIEGVVTEHVPSEHWKDAYDVVPVPAAELWRKLLAMMTDGGPTDAAARCLNAIDTIRDEHGVPESEPRHPDLASRKPWPILMPDPDAKGYLG